MLKGKKTTELRASHNADEIAFATVMKLRQEGKITEASVVQIATQSKCPSEVAHLLNTSKNSSTRAI